MADDLNQMVEKLDDMCVRLDTVPQCDVQRW